MHRYSIGNIKDWIVGGIDHSLAGNGGPECVNFISIQRRIIETVISLLIGTVYLYIGWSQLRVPPLPKVVREDRGGKRALTVLMCFIFGLEVGFKFSSKTLIYLLNPCHVITAIQIYLLAAPPTSRLVNILYRIHIHCIHGAVLAILLPVLNTRLLPFEAEVYWLQHGMMLIIPFYFLRLRGVYTVERLDDFSWNFFTLGINYFYHMVLLQILGIISEVNLNNVVCPAISDPFYGTNYRVWALFHQSFLIHVVGKIYTAISIKVLGREGRMDGYINYHASNYVNGYDGSKIVNSSDELVHND
ncbi:TMEM164 (predicted) [Pycnogonum litorale]